MNNMNGVFFFSYKTLGFYPIDDRAEYESSGTWPNDAVALTKKEEIETRSAIASGKVISQGDNGKPIFSDAPVVELAAKTVEEIQSLRLAAYRSESDHLKLEAEYNSLSSGETPDYSAWIAKVEEIKSRYPLPE